MASGTGRIKGVPNSKRPQPPVNCREILKRNRIDPGQDCIYVIEVGYSRGVRRAYPNSPLAPNRADMAEEMTDPAVWVDEYGDYLYRYALMRVRKQDVAEELVQETFLAALRSRTNFSGKSTVRTWLVGILKHKVVDQFRRSVRERPVSEITGEDQSDQDIFDANGMWKRKPGDWNLKPEEMYENKEFWAVLNQCISKLPERMAEVFTLREFEELSTAELCNILEVTATNLGVILHRSRNRLRKCLEINWFDKKDNDT